MNDLKNQLHLIITKSLNLTIDYSICDTYHLPSSLLPLLPTLYSLLPKTKVIQPIDSYYSYN